MHAGVLYHPDYTVGSGIAPDLLTPPNRAGARGLMRRDREAPSQTPPVGTSTPPRERLCVRIKGAEAAAARAAVAGQPGM